MKRQLLTNELGWFDLDSTTTYGGKRDKEGVLISSETGKQNEHQTMHRTAKGNWVRYFAMESERGPTEVAWELVESEQAVVWMIANGHEDALTDEDLESCEV